MGKPCFSKVIKFFALALLVAATAIAAVAVLSSPAAAHGHTRGGGGDVTPKPWDTDNLRYTSGRYNAQSFNIPYHKYGGYSEAARQSGVADTFFQAGGSVGAVNDFPYLGWVTDADGNESWAVQEGGTRSKGCDKFVEQQKKMAAQIVGNGGYYLDLSGKLRKLSGDPPSRFYFRGSDYVDWIGKGDGFAIDVNGNPGWVRRGNDYLERVDGYSSVRADGGRSVRAIYPSSTTWVLPTKKSSRYGQFGSGWHGTVSRGFVRVAKPKTKQMSYLPENIEMCPDGFHPRGEDSVDRIGHNTGRTLTGLTGANPIGLADYYWCRSDLRFARAFETQNHGVDLHPAAVGMTGAFQSYGRLNCYYTAFSSAPHGSSGTEGIRPASSGGLVCSYLFPLPQCTDSGSKRDFTETELKAYRIGESFTAPEDGSAACAEPPRCTANGAIRDMTDAELAVYRRDDPSFTPATDGTTPCVKPATPKCTDNGRKRDFTDAELAAYRRDNPSFTPEANGTTPCRRPNTPHLPPSLPGFSDDACVTANLQIYENRTAGSDAAPGVTSTDRTLAAATGRTAWDLDITSPHPLTASPPRVTGDASGCTDGSESRADHAASSGDAARSQSIAPSYASSAASDSAAPPNDADGDIDYTGAVKNMAHRYASKAAENTCAAKRAEAGLRVALLDAEANIYKDWMTRYSAWAGGMETGFSDWLDNNPALSTSSAANATFGSYKHAVRRGLRRTYASGMETFYAGRKNRSASVAGRSLTKPAVGSSWCGDVSSLISSYASSVGSLKTAATGVLSLGSAPSNPGSGPSVPDVRPSSAPSSGYVSSSADGTAPADAVYRTTNHSSSYCHTSGALPTSRYAYGTWVTYTYGGSCTITANKKTSSGTTVNISYTTRTLVTPAVAEVKATATATYYSYTSRLSSGNWRKTVTVPSAAGAATCRTWRRSSCYVSGTHPLHSGYVAWYTGIAPSIALFPTIAASPSNGSFTNISIHNLLGRYYVSDSARTGLKSTSASVRDTTATALGTLRATATGGEGTLPAAFSASVVPTTSQNATASTASTERSQINTAATTWRNAYTRTYNAAYTKATTDMGTTATTSTWNNFDWRYQTSTLDWGSYQEDPATTYSGWVAQAGETEADRDGTGCDLVSVASDGTVSVEATRLDYETSKYGKGNVYGTRSDAQRTCRIRRTRTPELLLEYQPSVPLETDTSKAPAFWHVNYQPTAVSERFKLYDEAEVFAVKASLADRAPVLCYQPGDALVAHVGAKGIDAVHKAVFNGASGFARGNKEHCYRHPSAAMLTPAGKTQPQPAFAFFDDTAHSAMESVNVVWQQPNPKIVSKLGSTDDLKMMANSVALVANAVAYADATRTSSFYGTYYTFPTDSSVESPSGWDISGHPALTLTSIFAQHQVQAKDAAAKTPTSHAMVFKFVDCVFGIEDVAFVDNIASPYALLSKDGVVPSGWKQSYDSDPHSSPTWYYPAFSTYEGALRLDGRRDSNGNPVTYGRNTQGGFSHPSYDLENTPADGMGWGIVYEDKVGKQQPVWAIYAPPVPGDKTRLALQVCGTGNLGAGGANPAATTGTPAARRIGTPATPPPASGVWSWKTSVWNYQDNPVMLWSVDDDPDREDKWEIKTSDSSANLPRKPHNNLEFATEDSTVAALDVFQDAGNASPAGVWAVSGVSMKAAQIS